MLLYLTFAIVSAIYEMPEASLDLAQSFNPKLIKMLNARFQYFSQLSADHLNNNLVNKA